MPSANFSMMGTVVESNAGVGVSNKNAGRIQDNYSNSNLDATYSQTIALASSTATLNLTALVRAGMANLNLTGMTVFGFMIKNNGANTMSFVKASTNGYDMFNLAPGHDVGPGGVICHREPNGFGVVGTSARDITVTGTGTQTFDIVLFADTV